MTKSKKTLISISIITLITLLIISIFCFTKNRIIISSMLNGKYWDLIRIDNQRWGKQAYRFDYFGSDGKYLKYYKKINKYDEGYKTMRFEIDDMEYPNTWSLINDSMLIKNGYEHKILILNDTFMRIQNKYDKTRILEYRLSKNQNPEISKN